MMACKIGLLFLVIALSFGVYSTSSSEYDYCVIGAGPGGIKLSKFYLILYIEILIIQECSSYRFTDCILSAKGKSELYCIRAR